MKKDKTMNRMETMPVKRLMVSMGIPMILSMMLQALYNIVDSAFVSNMKEQGEMALNALTLAFPVQVLMIAISIGTGVGVNALLSKSLGMKEYEQANYVAGNAIFLGVIIYIVYLLFGIFGVNVYMKSQTSNPVILEMGEEYLRICCIISIGIVFFSIYEKLLQATGNSLFSTIAQVSGAVVNIIFDPILIYGLFGLPELGVKGAAYATVFGQIVSFIVALIFHIKINRNIKNKVKYMRPSGRLILQIYAIGFPAIVGQALMAVMTYGLNIIFVKLSENVVTAYGLYYKIQQFILFAAFGLRDAITPIVSFSHGMKSKQRVKDGIRYGIIYTLAIMILGTLLLEVLAAPFSKVFGLSGETQQLCIDAMRIVSISFVFAGANVAFQGVFQALDGGLESLIVSVCRQLILVLPVAYLFVRIAKVHPNLTWLLWITFIIAEGITAVIGVLLMKRIVKRKVSVLK